MVPGEEADKWANLARRIIDCNTTGVPIPADLGEEFAELVRSCCRVGAPRRRFPYDDAEDLTQDILRRSWRALPRFRGDFAGDSLCRWVQQIISNSVKTYLIEKAKKPSISIEDILAKLDRTADPDEFFGSELHADQTDSPEDCAIAHDLQETLCSMLRQLPQKQRRAWEMHHVGKVAFCDVGAVLGIGEDAAKMAASRATKALQRAYDDYVHSQPSTAVR